MDFCPGCGKRSKGICKDCKPNAEIRYSDINIKICGNCKKIFSENKWSLCRDIKQGILKAARLKIRETDFKLDLELPELNLAPGAFEELDLVFSKDEDSFPIIGSLEVTLCNLCSKGQNEYFEGCLQIRNSDDEVLDYIEKYCKENNIFVTKADRTKDGYDLNVTDQKKIQNLGNHLQKHFGGVLKISPKIHTKNRQTGKDVYRVNVFFELPPFKKGDAILVKGRTYLVKGLGKDITCIDMKTGQNTTLSLKNIELKALRTEKTQVTRIHPHVEVLDPETYQSVKIENPREVSVGEKVKIVNSEGSFYLL